MFGPNQEGIRGASGGHWAQATVIGVVSEKSPNVPHVNGQALFILGTQRQLFYTLAIWFGTCFSPKNFQRGKSARRCGSKGVRINNGEGRGKRISNNAHRLR